MRRWGQHEDQLEQARLKIYQDFFDGALDANQATAKLLSLDMDWRSSHAVGDGIFAAVSQAAQLASAEAMASAGSAQLS